jgi:hypothetical protein
MTVNWWALIPLALAVAGGVGIGLICAPRRPRKAPTTYVVYRRWDDPRGHEILFESRSEKAAAEWLLAHRHDFGDEAGALGVQARSALDMHNAQAMADPMFWQTIEGLGVAWENLQAERALNETLRAEVDRRAMAALAGQAADPAFEPDLLHDTAGLLLEEVRRMLGASPPDGVPNVVQAAAWREQDEPGSVMPQFTPTEALTLDHFATAVNALPPPPAGAPAVTVLKPTSKPGTQTVVIPLGQVKP